MHAGRVYDYCIVGSGAAGTMAASILVQRGASVLMLEEGRDELGSSDFLSSQAHRERAFVTGRGGRLRLAGDPWTARTLGGGVRFYAGISFRYRIADFKAGAYLAATDLPLDWPIDYVDLQPYYDEVEHAIGVSRAPGADPTEPPCGPPPLPPHPFRPQTRMLADAGRHLGLHPFPTPLAINSQAFGSWPACSHQTSCTEHICPLGAKFDTNTRVLSRLRRHENFEIRAETKALRLQQDRPTRVATVEWLDLRDRRRGSSAARTFIVAGNAVQSAALLLRSANGWHPRGIGGASGLLGAGLSFKVSVYVCGVPRRGFPADQAGSGPHSTVAFTDHYEDPRCPTGLGGVIYEARPVRLPRIGDSATLRLHCIAGDHPMRRNRVRLSNRRNSLGIPFLHLDYTPHPLDRARLSFLSERAAELLRAAGCDSVTIVPSGYEKGSSHLHGTCRAGTSPSESVVTRDGRVHDIDNLYVADGGFMPFAGGLNPTLTIQANSLRIAQMLAGATGRGVQDA